MDVQDKIYAGILGKAIGVRLGAPIEPLQWTYERIYESFGDIKTYIKDSEIFAADDDTNGPIFFIRALIDDGIENFGPETVGKAWLNYARENAGMFWWGGDGVSTEHTAYLNLKRGMQAPQSGSSEVNGPVMANQVGGQIFVDSWGLLFPNNPKKAAEFSRAAASVSHDGNGLVGAEFIAAAISLAFTNKSIYQVIDQAIKLIDKRSDYYKKINKVYEFYLKNPNDFRLARSYVEDNFGYAHYEGACHIIPNAAICMIGLLYSKGDFARALEITVMCGWDTDSNAGVVGTIMGVLKGLEGIPEHYRRPINDTIIASSMSGYLNIVDIPNFALEVYLLSLKLDNILTKEDSISYKPGEINMSFEMKGSSHGLKIENKFRLLRDKISETSRSGYNILIDNLIENDEASVYYQTFYDDDYFGDDRYQPAFTPLVYDGQKVSIELETKIFFIDDIWVRAFVETNSGQTIPAGEWVKTRNENLEKLEFYIPDCDGDLVSKVGLSIKTKSSGIDGNGVLARFIIKSFRVSGPSHYKIKAEYQKDCMLDNVSSFVNNRAITKIKKDKLNFVFGHEKGLSLTGNYYTSSLNFAFNLHVIQKGPKDIVFWAKGLFDYYSLRIVGNKISLVKVDGLKETILSHNDLVNKEEYNFELKIQEGLLTLLADKSILLRHEFDAMSYGHFGFGGLKSEFNVSELEVKSDIIDKNRVITID